MARSLLLSCEEVGKAYGARSLFDGLTLGLFEGDQAGLVGPNGSGKSTLLKILAGDTAPDHGSRSLRNGVRVGYVPQDPVFSTGRTVDDVVLAALTGVDEEDRPGRLAHALSRGGFADGRASVDTLSGGWKKRLAIARELAAEPDILLMDEPTNHLDVDAKEWLMRFLRAFGGALLVVSHDLQLLDQAITKVLHLDDGEVRQYKGTYSQYVSARAKDEDRLRRIAARQHAEIGRLSTLADRMRHSSARRARQAKSLDKRVERLAAEAVTPIRTARSVRYRFPVPPHSGRDAVQIEGLTKTFGDRTIWSELAFALRRGERLLVLGLNGAGKTTLLRVLAGLEVSDAGDVIFGTGVSLGYYAQEHEGIMPGTKVIDHVRPGTLTTETEQRGILGAFGLTGDVAFQDAGSLSGGEKTKLALAQLVAGRHNLLLLDEPTNNLDPPSRSAIGTALSSWPGSIVLVSHDVEYVDALAPDFALLLPDGTLDYWSNDLLDLVPLA